MGAQRQLVEPLLDVGLPQKDPQNEILSGAGAGCPLGAFRPPEQFLRHPGGQEHLKTAAGSPCPGLMFLASHTGCDDVKISVAARSMGVPLPDRGALYSEVHELVKMVKAQHKGQHFIFVVHCLLITAALPICFAWFLCAPSVLASICNALVFELYFLNIFHTRHHKGPHLYNVPVLDRLTAPLYSFIDRTWGYHPPAWWQNHHVKHHMHTNVSEVDPDMPDMYPIIRMFPEQQRLWFHRFQTIYWPLMLPFSVSRFPVSNLLEHGGHPTFFFAWSTLMFVLPLALHGLRGLACSLLVQGLCGISITYKFAVSHCHTALLEPRVPQASETEVDVWAIGQIQESTSWGGYWSCLILGGINMQIEHHLAPSVDPPLLAFIAPELRKICAKHGIRYVYEPSFLHALSKFHARLWVMGAKGAM